MTDKMTITIGAFSQKPVATAVVFVSDALKSTKEAAFLGAVDSAIARAAPIEKFTGKAKSVLVITGAPDLHCERLIVVGLGKVEDQAKTDWVMLGGTISGKLKTGATQIIAAVDGVALSSLNAGDIALGLRLRNYNFDKYKTKKKDEDEPKGDRQVALMVGDVAETRKALKISIAIADGVDLAREVVNEPPNVLNPATFAKKAAALSALGVEVEVLGEKELKKLGMRALLAVGQGSRNESHVAIMRWNGTKATQQPVAFVGKGVTFDTGGISIKPAGGMEDMKGDMAGAACVLGLMHTLAARKAKVNAIGVIGLVENMPDGNAQRPGDIVTSMSGQTIEIINTDAEGRLVLADILWHTQAAFKPQFMVNLATLTGAILVALGQDHAGLFSNNDTVAERIAASGKTTGERVWRMPLDPVYDKIIDSRFADVKNSGGRYAGSITAAQFLQRFVNDCPWAHLDIAGTGMASSNTDINRSWGSGWGVRLLNDMVAQHYES